VVISSRIIVEEWLVIFPCLGICVRRYGRSRIPSGRGTSDSPSSSQQCRFVPSYVLVIACASDDD
jgi:hypothetical protein